MMRHNQKKHIYIQKLHNLSLILLFGLNIAHTYSELCTVVPYSKYITFEINLT